MEMGTGGCGEYRRRHEWKNIRMEEGESVGWTVSRLNE